MEVSNGQDAELTWESLIAGNCSESDRQRKRKALLDDARLVLISLSSLGWPVDKAFSVMFHDRIGRSRDV